MVTFPNSPNFSVSDGSAGASAPGDGMGAGLGGDSLRATPDIGVIIESPRPLGPVALTISWVVIIALSSIVSIPFFFSVFWWVDLIIAGVLLSFWLLLVWHMVIETRKRLDFGTLGVRVRVGERVVRTVMYRDVKELLYFPMNVRSHGVTIGTSVVLRIKPAKGSAIAFTRMNPLAATAQSPLPAVSNFDPVRDLIAGAQAEALHVQLRTQGRADWTKRLKFEGGSLTYKPILGSRRELAVSSCEVLAGPWSMTLMNRATQKKFAELSTTEANCWAGLILLLRLFSEGPPRVSEPMPVPSASGPEKPRRGTR
ncbi:MAG: hypothetical protein IBJ18_10865 [Phycisphaerales bacterium]|nr:hypothetical protein [Phycisphaerales bacterium]